jgi:hypothetical protein
MNPSAALDRRIAYMTLTFLFLFTHVARQLAGGWSMENPSKLLYLTAAALKTGLTIIPRSFSGGRAVEATSHIYFHKDT